MTEEIIIDGVNVAGCEYFQREDGEYTCGAEECNGAVVGCRACDNCYYKQLQRLKQENAELKKNGVFIPIPPQETVPKREYERIRKALEEIREIADIIYNTNCNYVVESHKILDKVDEVLNEVDR